MQEPIMICMLSVDLHRPSVLSVGIANATVHVLPDSRGPSVTTISIVFNPGVARPCNPYGGVMHCMPLSNDTTGKRHADIKSNDVVLHYTWTR